MNTYGFIAQFKTQAGKRDELVTILLQAAEAMSTAQSCRQYLVSKDTGNENLVVVTELWDSKEDHDNALKIDGATALISKAMPLLDGRPQVNVLDVIGGKR